MSESHGESTPTSGAPAPHALSDRFARGDWSQGEMAEGIRALESALEQAVRDRDSLARRAVALEDEAEQREAKLERAESVAAGHMEAVAQACADYQAIRTRLAALVGRVSLALAHGEMSKATRDELEPALAAARGEGGERG